MMVKRKTKRKESRAAMLARLKAQRRKAGIGEFRKKRTTTRRAKRRTTRATTTQTVKTVARRRRSFTRRRVRRGKSGVSMKNLVVGMAIASVAEPFVEQFTARIAGSTGFGAIADDAIKAVGGFLVAKKVRNPIMKATAMSFALIGVRNIVSQRLGGLVGAQSSAPVFAQTVI
jgi:hypothetical protein